MEFPKLQEVSRYREMTTIFGGYNHQISCEEGQFFDMKNMTSKYFPVLSPRQNRGIVKTFINPQGILDKEDIWWIDDKVLYKNGVEKVLNGVTLSDESPKTLSKMGAYIIIMPDKIWCKINPNDDSKYIECGYMENRVVKESAVFSICEASGKIIEWHDAEYYKSNTAKDGDYMMTVTSDGKPSLKIYSETTGIWLSLSSTYVQISAEGIGKGFEKGDGVKVAVTFTKKYVNDSEDEVKTEVIELTEEKIREIKDALEYIMVNTEGDNSYSTNTYIVDRTDDAITIPGIFKCINTNGSMEFKNINFSVIRSVPQMSFITECNNRLWGCSADGHEVYCSKLGDVKNWNCFMGTSTDSWAATIGSDGKFTGAVTYLGYPIFFKEDCLVKIAVSATGGHQTKETKCRGVQSGSGGSLAILNEILYYKSPSGVCGYNGSLPYSISDEFGDIKYYDAVAGAIGDKYYISMHDNKGVYNLFVYDTKNGIWCKEDNTHALFFCKHDDDLYYIDKKDKVMKSVDGTLLYGSKEGNVEGKFDWFVESGAIGYSSPDNKYIGRINLRITLEIGTSVAFFIQYDSCCEWEYKFNISGTGTRTYSVPIIPKRCDHFKYKISGIGGCKIHSVTKTIEEGSEG